MPEIPFFITEYKARNPATTPRQRIGIVKEAGTIKVTSRPITKVSMMVEALYDMLDDLTQEAFYVVSLDAQKRIIGVHMVSLGTLSASLVHPRDVFKVPIALDAPYIITVHNHPSGNATPSRQDLELYERMDHVALLLGTSIIDHLIVGQGARQWYSLRMQRIGIIGG